MLLIDELEPLRAACVDARRADKRVALVPTMGALHEGHLSLVRQARQRADFVVVSIFVNPTQFAAGEDLDRYPRTLRADAEHCRAAGVNLVFAPTKSAMYPSGEQTRVKVGEVAQALCGAHRDGHFEGVATIVCKLLTLVGPCVAVFGRKDYQQLCVIKRMVTDLLLPVEVVGAPIVREADGLALSSRNRYLSAEQRVRALSLSRGLSLACAAFEAGQRNVGTLRQLVVAALQADELDYVTMTDADTVIPLPVEAPCGDRALLAVAARVGSTRLIDNVVLGEDAAPIQS